MTVGQVADIAADYREYRRQHPAPEGTPGEPDEAMLCHMARKAGLPYALFRQHYDKAAAEYKARELEEASGAQA